MKIAHSVGKDSGRKKYWWKANMEKPTQFKILIFIFQDLGSPWDDFMRKAKKTEV
jgi:hypothetical protein